MSTIETQMTDDGYTRSIIRPNGSITADRNKSNHKKKNGPELICSRDKDGNVLCAGCKMLLISKDVTDDNLFDKMISNLLTMGGIYNCCYDCGFSWYCNKCCFITIHETKYFKTCGNSMMKQLLDQKYGGGRHSTSKNENYWTHLRKFFAKDMKYGLHKNSLIGKVAHVEKIIEIYDGPNPEKNIKMYKENIKKYRNKMIPLDMSQPAELNNIEDNIKFHYVEE